MKQVKNGLFIKQSIEFKFVLFLMVQTLCFDLPSIDDFEKPGLSVKTKCDTIDNCYKKYTKILVSKRFKLQNSFKNRKC